MLRSVVGQWAGSVYMALLSMLTSFVIGRVLGAASFADFSYVTSIAYVYLVMMDGGFKTMVFREETRRSRDTVLLKTDLVPAGLGHLILFTILGCVLVPFLPVYFPAAVMVSFLFMATFAAGSLVSARLKGRGRFLRDAGWQAGFRTLSALGMLTGLFIGHGNIAAIFVGGAAGGTVVLLVPLFSGLLPLPGFSGLTPALYRRVLLFLMIDAATQVYFRSDIILLRYMSPDLSGVGNYAAAARLIGGAALLLAPLGQVFFRRLRLLENRASFHRSLWPAVFAISGCGLVVAVFLLFSPPCCM